MYRESASASQLSFRSNIGQPGDNTFLDGNRLYCGDSRTLLRQIEPEAVALSFWSPPYFVGKSYERHLSFEQWQDLLREVIRLHFNVIAPGGFLAVNIADILAFPDPEMPRIQADNISSKRSGITREQVLSAQREHPDFNRYQLAELLGCSEQTIDRRLSREEWSEWGSRAVWHIPSVRNNSEHEAQFPLELPRRVIRIFSGDGDLVLDPFMGLGTTAVAAIREGRRYIGIDYMAEYVEKAAGRISLMPCDDEARYHNSFPFQGRDCV